jgi:Tfp pilus assembly protein FimT
LKKRTRCDIITIEVKNQLNIRLVHSAIRLKVRVTMYYSTTGMLMGRAKNNSGITLVELMMVIVVIVLLAAVAVPNLAPMVDLMKLRTAANTIKRQMIIARTRALSDPNTHVGVCINRSTNPNTSYVFLDRGTLNQYDAANDLIYNGVFIMPKNIYDSIPSVANGGITDSVVVFRGDGSAKNGGKVIVKNKRGKMRIISILASTGRVKMY